MKEVILSNAQIVLANEVIHGTLVMENGFIKSIDQGQSQLSSANDMQGDFLLPGLIELHTDNLEKHFTPRPKVTWPAQPAVLAHDAQLVAAGITTVFDAVALGDVNEGSQRIENLHAMIDAIEMAQNKNLTRAQHWLHLRCEVCHSEVINLLEPLIEKSLVKLISVMDHSPGQRQFTNMDKYKIYYQGKYHLDNDQLDSFIQKQQANSELYSDKHRKAVVSMCQERGIPVASHDDATAEHVEESAAFGMRIAEFPTTKTAATLSHKKGMGVMMGAPNVVRGGSHSGNIAAHELAKEGVLDILSSDYCPASILHAAFILKDLENDYDLPKAINTISLNPARACGLNDRGELAIGKRSDITRVNLADNLPVVQQVFIEGQRAF